MDGGRDVFFLFLVCCFTCLYDEGCFVTWMTVRGIKWGGVVVDGGSSQGILPASIVNEDMTRSGH